MRIRGWYLLDGKPVRVTGWSADHHHPAVDVVDAQGRGRWAMWGGSSKHRWGTATLSDVLAARGITHHRDDTTEADGRRSWADAAGLPLGRFTAEEGWAFVGGAS